MKKFLFGLLITMGLTSQAQTYNNEWIDYSKTYFKFKVGKDGLYRIPQSVLSSAGLGSTPAENFQLWRNGAQVPIYTSVASGVLSSGDYIEFWGLMNDGKPDRELYRDPSYQLNNRWSLETDTAAFFLTVNANTAENLRLNPTLNNVAGNSLPEEPYFIYTAGKYFNNKINPGYAVNVGEYLYSSSYDKGEGWTSTDISTSHNSSGVPNYGRNLFVFDSLFKYNGGPQPLFKIAVSGNAINIRKYVVRINKDTILNRHVDFFNYVIDTVTFSATSLKSFKDSVTVTNMTQCATAACPPTDRMVVHMYEIIYPRKFNFGRATNFQFELPATAVGNFLKITNFKYGAAIPVLYDLTNGKRYEAEMSEAPALKFALEPSVTDRKLVLVSEDPTNLNSVISLETRNFINYTSTAYHSDYIIISNPILYAGANGTNPVQEYRDYRNSVIGGSYTANIFESDELIDQFGFGIKKNPAAIRNFLLYARNHFQVSPKQVFIIGRGVNYSHNKSNESNPNINRLNLVPPFGVPASDVLFTSNPGSSLPQIPIGRLSAISADEVALYLKKVKDHELAQATSSPSTEDRAWMKNIVHIVGASEPGLESILSQNMDNYSETIRDTLFGAKVEKFSKSSSNAVEQLNSTRLQNLFSEGISLITYFGHSSTTTLEYNLDNPQNYNNFGKYPMFIGLGCNAGNFFNFSTLRLQTKETLSEKYVLSADRGTIGFVASTHFGIVHYLDVWASRAYQQMASKSYGLTMGEIMKNTAADVFDYTTEEDFYARCNTEQSELHGDPAIRLNPHEKPDYVIEDQMVKVSPGFVSVADVSFNLNAQILNIGSSPDKSIVVEVKRQVPGQAAEVFFRDTIPGIRYMDSVVLDIPINPTTDKGLNKFTITIDADGEVDELYENNNVIEKEVMIYEDEARPVYPYAFAIINKQNIKLIASTANPFADSKEYKMELDTTEAFNSAFKVVRTVTSSGGVMEFDPGITFTDSTVYYWRVAPVVTTGSPSWNTSSFVYLANSDVGFNQSHVSQHIKSKGVGISMDPDTRKWEFGTRYQNLFVKHGTWVTSTGQENGVSIAVNSLANIRNSCWYQCLSYTVFDPVTFVPWTNTTHENNSLVGGMYGSGSSNCYYGRIHTFEYRWDSVSNRERAMNFMENVIPDGHYVVVRSFLLDPNTYPTWASKLSYAPTWQNDTLVHGSGNSIYHSLKNAGFSGIDSFYKPRQFVLIYKKNDPTFAPIWTVSDGTFDNITLSADCPTPDTAGRIVSPMFGPALEWKELKWRGDAMESIPGDNPRVDLIGINNAGIVDTLLNNLDISQQNIDISFINAAQYPFVQLQMKNADTSNVTPYQLRYWRLTYDPAPEGAIAPNLHFTMKDTFDIAEPLEFKVAFRNISEADFDSIKVKMIVTDRNNVQHDIPVVRHRPLASNPSPNDTLHVRVPLDTRQIAGINSMYIEVNPDNDQPEQYHFNNFAYRNFYVRPDTLNPLLDVTFDNVHILNHDIVSSRPNILIKLKDEAKWFLLDNSNTLDVQVRFPDGSLRPYQFGADTLQFMPAQEAPNNDNTATAVFKPYFPEDGEYELIVKGKDMSENTAGKMEYRVNFQVINKAMISNMMNYPNPFTTSTAFVFTLTGSEVPQNIRIQVLTITGKIVREITKDELGPLHIGRNITEFKWDGTDQYGQKLANGVYLYRVITNLNGKSLDKYTSQDDNTDKYFNKGYGKMYLMR